MKICSICNFGQLHILRQMVHKQPIATDFLPEFIHRVYIMRGFYCLCRVLLQVSLKRECCQSSLYRSKGWTTCYQSRPASKAPPTAWAISPRSPFHPLCSTGRQPLPLPPFALLGPYFCPFSWPGSNLFGATGCSSVATTTFQTS
jgi:hypothetical protein